MTVGILYPRSSAHPDMGVDFVDGIKALIKKEIPDGEIQLLMEGVGFGGSEKEVYEKAEKLLRIEKADVLIAFIDQKVLAVLEPLVHSTGSLLLVVNAGANYPSNWISQPNIMYLTLHHAFLCSLSGRLASQRGPAKAVMATTFFDCGYLHTAAMVNGFVEQGGSIAYNYVNNQKYNESFEISQLTDFLDGDKETSKLLSAFDSFPATLFYDRLKNYEDANRLELFVSPMMLEENGMNALLNAANFSVKGYKPWQLSLTNKYNESFIDFYRKFSKKDATIFSLLGWEAGLVLQQLNKYAGTQSGNGVKLAEQMKKVKLESPRGEMFLDEETNYFLTPAIKLEIAGGEVATTTVPIETVRKDWQTFTVVEADPAASGWTNTYLCY